MPGARATIAISGSHLRFIRERRAVMSQKELAAKIGISEGALASIETGRQKKVLVGTFRAIANSLGMTIDEAMLHLAEIDDKLRFWERATNFAPIEMRPVPFFDAKIPAGQWVDTVGGTRSDAADGYVEVPRDSPRGAFALRIFGDCMSPEFPNGSIVIFAPTLLDEGGAGAEEGKPYYVQTTDDRATFKFVFYEAKKKRYRLECLNPRYKPMFLPEAELARLSRAVGLLRDL